MAYTHALFTLLMMAQTTLSPGWSALVRHRRSSGGDILNITITLMEPFTNMRVGQGFQGNERFYGYVPDLIQELSKEIGFKYRFIKSDDFGSPLPNGSWKGQVGMLIRGEGDIAGGPLSITSLRERVVVFTKPFMVAGLSILIKKEWKKPTNYHILDMTTNSFYFFMRPLTLQVWISVLVVYFVVSVFLALNNQFNPYELRSRSRRGMVLKEYQNTFGLAGSLWYAFSTFQWQGYEKSPGSLAGRIISASWFTFVSYTMLIYTAGLVSFFQHSSLTTNRLTAPIHTAEDLAKQSTIQYGVVRGSKSEETFKLSRSNLYSWMYTTMKTQSSFVNNMDEGIERAKAGGYGFITETPSADYIAGHHCDLMTIKMSPDQYVEPLGYALAVPQNSHLNGRLNVAITQLNERHHLQKLYAKWWFERYECKKDKGPRKPLLSRDYPPPNPVSLLTFGGVLSIPAVGIILGIIMSIIEKIVFKVRGKKYDVKRTTERMDRLTIDETRYLNEYIFDDRRDETKV